MTGSPRPAGSLPPLTLVIGGARSGKSRHAEALVAATGLPRTYIATAEAWDDEMRARIAQHRTDRGAGWQTVEAPQDLAPALCAVPAGRVVLVDCLTLWLTRQLMPLSNDLEQNRPPAHDWPAQAAMFLKAIEACPGPIVLVGNEIGLGVIPLGREVRAFVDALGVLNQQVAAACERVTLMAAGLPLCLKGAS